MKDSLKVALSVLQMEMLKVVNAVDMVTELLDHENLQRFARNMLEVLQMA